MSEGEERISIFESIRRLIERKIFSNNTRYGIIKTILYKRKGAAMNQSIGQQFAVFRYEKIVWLLKRLHLLADAVPSTRLLYALRQPVFLTVRRGAFLLSECLREDTMKREK